MPGQFILHDVARGDRSFEIEVTARGHFRRKRGNCSFPPYRLNFKKKEVKGTIFDGLDKVKVVSHCRETRKSFERYIFREYLAYKTLNILTEASFRVRLLNIKYVDSKGRYKPRQYAAFFIEPVEQLAKRLDGILVTERHTLPSKFNEEALCMAELFQFLIGNTIVPPRFVMCALPADSRHEPDHTIWNLPGFKFRIISASVHFIKNPGSG